MLRYEKRTKKYPYAVLGELKSFTVKEETIDDALAAVALLRQNPKIDPRRIFLLGHSLGGMLAPRIAARDGRLAGLILMAATTRSLPDLILQQTRYIFSLDGKVDRSESKQLSELEEQVNRVKDLDISEGELVLGASKAYWADLLAYDPVKTAQGLKLPLLILQGGRDYQVTREDFAGWQRGLAGREGVSFKFYPHLNHLFMLGIGKSTPAEYAQPGHVAQKVIEDIAGWVVELER